MKTRVLKPLLFTAPALLIFMVLWMAPIVISLVMSFFDTAGFASPWVFDGLGNYRHIFNDPLFYTSLFNNIKWMGLSVIFPIAIGLAFALMLNTKFKFRTLFRGIFYYPSILSLVAVGLIWGWMLSPNGLIASLQKIVGATPFALLGNTRTALYGTFIAGAWSGIGVYMIMFMAGLQTIPTELYEVADIEGANKVQKFWYVTLPLLRQTFIIVISLALINSMKVFDIIMVTTRGGPGSSTYLLSIYMYVTAFRNLDMGIGAAISITMVILVSIIVIPYVMTMQKADDN